MSGVAKFAKMLLLNSVIANQSPEVKMLTINIPERSIANNEFTVSQPNGLGIMATWKTIYIFLVIVVKYAKESMDCRYINDHVK